MKLKIVLSVSLILLGYTTSFAQPDPSATGYSEAGNHEVWVELPERLQAKYYYGRAERFEIEVSGGYHGDYGRVVYYIDARNGLGVMKHSLLGDVRRHQLKIYSDDSKDNSDPDRYVVGFRLGYGSSWWSIDIRARSLRDGKWMTLNETSEPGSGFSEVTPTIKDNLFISSDGEIGINTTDPTAKLAVNGTTKAKEVVVTENAGDWPDYVFTDAYQLTELNELERYIDTRNHLPGIPKKEYVEQDGQNLGIIQKKLLEKIEELTLHMIEQNKVNRRQQKLIKSLRSEVKKLKKELR